MAASGDSTIRYKFVEKIPEDFMCPVCLDAVYDAVEAKCCGVPLCKSCSERLAASMMGCPQCRKSPLKASENLFVRCKVRQLHIYCVNKDCCNIIYRDPYPIEPNYEISQLPLTIGFNHCTWSGEINDLQSHLDKHCPHTTVACQYDCGVKIARCQKDDHEAKVCHKRPFSCWFCCKKATAEEIDGHAIKCDKRPIECPNKCLQPVNELLQGELQRHLQQCPLQEISCEFEHAGCKEKILRKDYSSHIEDNTQKHLTLMSTQLRVVASELKETKREIEKANKRINLLTQVNLQNVNISVPNYGTSEPFYVQGYCMSVSVVHSIVNLHLQHGQYDDILSWPLKGDVTLLLLHPKDSSKNRELVYRIYETQRPTKPDKILCLIQIYAGNSYLTNNEYRLSVKSATFT